MLGGKSVFVVMPGLNVARTIERTVTALPRDVIDEVLFVDDGSRDGSIDVARSIPGVKVFAHARNLGYGAGQKTGYRESLRMGADVVVMVHPDFQYKPELAPALAAMIVYGGYEIALGSRMLMQSALAGGMPRWKWVANKALTGVENAMLGAGLSEYHTGYRAFSARALRSLPMAENRNDFVFDNEVLAQAIHLGLPIGELSCPAHYFDEMSTITFWPGVKYGLGVLGTTARLRMHRAGLRRDASFAANGRGLDDWHEGSAVTG